MKKIISIFLSLAILCISVTAVLSAKEDSYISNYNVTYNEVTDVDDLIDIAYNSMTENPNKLIKTYNNSNNINAEIVDGKIQTVQKLNEQKNSNGIITQECVLSSIALYDSTEEKQILITRAAELNEYSSRSMNGYSVVCNLYFTCTISGVQRIYKPIRVTTTIVKGSNVTGTVSSGTNTLRVVQSAITKFNKTSEPFYFSNGSLSPSQTFTYYPTGLSSYYIQEDRPKSFNDIYGTSKVSFSNGKTLWVDASLWDYLNR